ncbi:MAG: phosphoglucosamine mutase [Rhodospirillaceae bacterium]|jgi:phosphoglucosamine mutase|nr:phosphoglucosamine mutase [Rhodospirillaceae bacterium]MBT6405940.1 phosphoglucosamine mutase [Rhodospirillaceae bacterium]MBT6535878.1 phosphoglucosamine mutase [Rhodospirillaceae bacterium]MBT7362734.1 phosphoglucosamine mutase [Rhodospirillaceae bacterium]
MARKLFGTDGIRGKANQEPMTAETALRVAMAAGHRFTRGDHRHLVIIGKDTRLSNYMLEPAMQAGFTAMGMDVVLVGPMPTPAVAMLTRTLRADLGVVLSASHNPYEDNGIKLFGPDGFKLSDAVEEEIEALIENGLLDHLADAGSLGRARRLEDAPGRYIEFVKHTFPRGLRLDGLKVVVDCANGAAYKVAPSVFHELGADVIPMAIDPDGTNINRDCGATATDALQQQVVTHGAHLGVALDGDADRVILCDESGEVVDGDQVMAVIARSWQAAERLQGGKVVATVMSNLGFERYLQTIDLEMERAKVGDRYVLERMRAGGYNLGGEQSGHIILSDYSTTGDGLIAALQVLAALVESGAAMSALTNVFESYPQLLRNVPADGAAAMEHASVISAVTAAEAKLGDDGRVLIRPSGTEPVIRVMAEGLDAEIVTSVVDEIAGAIADVPAT